MAYMRTGFLLTFLLVLSACSSTPDQRISDLPPVKVDKPTPPKQIASETPLGVCKMEQGKVGRPYKIRGVTYTPKHDPNYVKTGVASYYGKEHHGKSTANGETFDMHALSAAHTTLPLPSCVLVTNLKNNKSVVLRVNDRGPFVKSRIIDVSYRAAQILDFVGAGLTEVRVEAIEGTQ